MLNILIGNQPAWITALGSSSSSSSRKKVELEKKHADLKKRIDQVREIEDNKAAFELATKERKRKKVAKDKLENDQEFLLDDYESDDEEKVDKTSNLSKEVQELLAK
jgi:hypothetical protein